jgi:hypothetical protein
MGRHGGASASASESTTPGPPAAGLNAITAGPGTRSPWSSRCRTWTPSAAHGRPLRLGRDPLRVLVDQVWPRPRLPPGPTPRRGGTGRAVEDELHCFRSQLKAPAGWWGTSFQAQLGQSSDRRPRLSACRAPSRRARANLPALPVGDMDTGIPAGSQMPVFIPVFRYRGTAVCARL